MSSATSMCECATMHCLAHSPRQRCWLNSGSVECLCLVCSTSWPIGASGVHHPPTHCDAFDALESSLHMREATPAASSVEPVLCKHTLFPLLSVRIRMGVHWLGGVTRCGYGVQSCMQAVLSSLSRSPDRIAQPCIANRHRYSRQCEKRTARASVGRHWLVVRPSNPEYASETRPDKFGGDQASLWTVMRCSFSPGTVQCL